MLPALNQIGAQQSQPTQKTRKKVHRLLDYANTHQDTSLRFFASDMQLTVNSDVAFLVLRVRMINQHSNLRRRCNDDFSMQSRADNIN